MEMMSKVKIGKRIVDWFCFDGGLVLGAGNHVQFFFVVNFFVSNFCGPIEPTGNKYIRVNTKIFGLTRFANAINSYNCLNSIASRAWLAHPFF